MSFESTTGRNCKDKVIVGPNSTPSGFVHTGRYSEYWKKFSTGPSPCRFISTGTSHQLISDRDRSIEIVLFKYHDSQHHDEGKNVIEHNKLLL